MLKKLSSSILTAFLFVFAFSGVSHAAQPKQMGKFGDWTAYVLEESGNKVCYMVSKPVSAKGNYTRRGEIFALITHRPKESTHDVFSYITGYTYKPKSNAKVTVDGKSFSLFTQDDTAWAPDAATDTALALAIRKGSKMVVEGTSSRGTLTTDTYSLKGSSGAYEKISKECGVPF